MRRARVRFLLVCAKTVAKLFLAKSSKTFELAGIVNCTTATTNIAAMALVQTNPDAYVIKPEASAPAVDTSDWPLLLKNYSECMQQLLL